jgi:hypothetical protein
MKKLILFLLMVSSVISSAQPQIKAALQVMGADTNFAMLLHWYQNSVYVHGTTVGPVTLATTPPVTSSSDPGLDAFVSNLGDSLIANNCFDILLGDFKSLVAAAILTLPQFRVVSGGQFAGIIGSTPVLSCSTPVCSYLAARNDQCVQTDAVKFESTNEFRINAVYAHNSPGKVVFGGAFSGTATLGGNTYNAGVNEFGIISDFEFGAGSSWQGILSGTGFFSFDDMFYDKSTDEIFALAKIGITAMYEDTFTTTPITAQPPGNAYALLRINALTGALLDHTTISSSGLILSGGLIKTLQGVYVVINNLFGNVFPDALLPSFLIPSLGGADIDVLQFDLSLNYVNSTKLSTPQEDFATNILDDLIDPPYQMFPILGYSFRNSQLAGSQPDNSPAFNAQAIMYLLDQNLNRVDSIITGGKQFDAFFDGAIDPAGNLYLTGIFTDTTDLDPDTTSVFSFVSAGSFDGFVAKYDVSNWVGINETGNPSAEIIIAPNPAADEWNLHASFGNPANGKIQLFDSMGRLMYQFAFSGKKNLEHKINCRLWAPGIYIVAVSNNGTIARKKIIRF